MIKPYNCLCGKTLVFTYYQLPLTFYRNEDGDPKEVQEDDIYDYIVGKCSSGDCPEMDVEGETHRQVIEAWNKKWNKIAREMQA